MKKILILLLFCIISLLNYSSTYGQRLIHLMEHDLSAYPSVSISYFVFSGNGLPDFSDSQSDFSITVNGKMTSASYQNCLNINPADNSTILISADLSIRNNLMDNYLDKAKRFIDDLISNINVYNITAGLHSFNNYAYLNYDFTDNQNDLRNAMKTMLFSSGSIIDTGMFSNPLGAFELIKNKQGPKTIIFLSSTNSEFDAGKVIQVANQHNIKIIPIYFGNIIPARLIDLANGTGGHLIAISDSSDNIKPYALSALAFSRNFSPCVLAWNNQLNCDDIHTTIVKINSDNIKDTLSFFIGDDNKPGIVNTPGYLRFSSVQPGSSKSMNISFSAKNGDITITDLILVNPLFSIDSGDIAAPVILQKDSARTLKITFNPVDSAIVFDSLRIISDACSGTTVLITGGYPNTPPNERTLTLLSPNCQDNLLVGDTALVSWTGLLPADVIQLQYTRDLGKNWDTLATDITGLDYYWEVPDIASDSCLVRVIQLWPNNIGQTMVLQHEGGVNCANFNRDGSLVITASKDKKNLARVWNANNGQLVYELKGHNKAINWVNFDLQDKYAVSSSDDSTAIIWDIKKGEIVRKLVGHNDVVRSANFSPSGKYLLTVSNDKFAYIWDVETGARLSKEFKTGYPLWHGCFSPDEEYVLITDNAGNAVASKFNDQTVVKYFKSDQGVIPFAAFSQDMTKLATASWFGKATVWDFENNTELFSITHDSSKVIPINSCNFDNTGQLLLTAGVDTVPRLWDGNTGSSIATLLNEHTSSVQIASFNFDATRILTASWDSTAKVWNREQIGLQVDTSDCPFTITKVKILANDIVFTNTPYGTIRDTLVIPFISNELDFPLELKNYSISGANPDDFEVINNLPPLTIDSIGTTHIEVRFKPQQLGTRQAVLNMEFPGQIISINISGTAIDGPIELMTDIVDFGKVEIGDYKDTTIIGMIMNRTGSTILIDSVAKLGPDFFHFNILDDLTNTTLLAGQRLDLTLRFTPEDTRSLNSLFRIYHSAGNFPLYFSTYGGGVQPRIDTALIVIGTTSGDPGETIEIPITIANISSLGISSSISGFTMGIEFNATLLEPIENDSPVDILNGYRYIEVNLPSTFDADSILALLKFKVGLGNDTTTILRITDLAIKGNGKMVLKGQDGRFDLLGFCKSGGNRLFESEGRIQLSQNVPNPVIESTNISFEVIESGYTEIVLIDILGNKIKTVISGNLKPGIFSLNLSNHDLPAGKVFYILRTPTQSMIKSMDIIK